MAEEVGIEYGRAHGGRAMGRRAERRSARSAPRCTRWPTPSPPTASPPTPKRKGDELRIVSNHCPFGAAAIEHPVICAVDRGMVKGMLADALRRHRARDRQSSLPRGDDVCVTVVLTRPPAERRPVAATTSTTRRPRRPGPRPSTRMVGVAASPAGGDPARIHTEGQAARVAVEEARDAVAALLGARAREVVFTSGATEAIARGHVGRRVPSEARQATVAWSPAVEHSAVRLGSAAPRPEVPCVGCDASGRVDRRRPAGRRPTGHRARPPAVGQPRGRHAAAGGRGGGRLPRAGRAGARRRRAGRGPRARRLRRPRRRPDVGQRPQDGRPAGRRRAARAARPAPRPLLVGGDQERARRAGFENVPAHRRLGRGRALRLAGDARRRGARPPAASRSGSSAVAAALDGVDAVRRPARTGSPTSCASAIAGRRAAGGAARARPGRHRRALGQRLRVARTSSRRRCWRRWASTPTGRCGSAWAGARPTPTSTPWSTRCPSVLGRLRALGARPHPE